MRTLEVGCDKCAGPIVDGGGAVLVVVAGPRSLPWPTTLSTGLPALDLCGQCLGELTSWLRQPVAADGKGGVQ